MRTTRTLAGLALIVASFGLAQTSASATESHVSARCN